jgi:hypothetical protein
MATPAKLSRIEKGNVLPIEENEKSGVSKSNACVINLLFRLKGSGDCATS